MLANRARQALVLQYEARGRQETADFLRTDVQDDTLAVLDAMIALASEVGAEQRAAAIGECIKVAELMDADDFRAEDVVTELRALAQTPAQLSVPARFRAPLVAAAVAATCALVAGAVFLG